MAIKHTNFDELQEKKKSGQSSTEYKVGGETYTVVNVDTEKEVKAAEQARANKEADLVGAKDYVEPSLIEKNAAKKAAEDAYKYAKEQERLEYLNVKEARDKKYALEQELDALRKETGGTTTLVSSALNPRKNAQTQVLDKNKLAQVEALQKEIDELNRDIELASRTQQKKYMTETATKAEDFEKYSTVEPVAEDEVAEKGYRIYKTQNQGRETDTLKGYMNEKEKGIYNYYYNKVGKEKAEEYFETIREDLSERQANAMYAGNEDSVAAQLLFTTQSGLERYKESTKGMGRMLLGDESYSPATTYDYLDQKAAEDLYEKGVLPKWIEEKTGIHSVGQLAHDFVSTTTYMAPAIALGTVTGTGMAPMVVAAAGDAYREKINEGYSKDQATAYGVIMGASEYAIGKVVGAIGYGGKTVATKAFDKFLPKIDKVGARIAYKYGTTALSEGAEESLQEYLEPIYRNIALNEENEAKYTTDVLYAGILGALSGGLIEGTPYAIGEIKTAINNKKTTPKPETNVPEAAAEAAKEGAVKGAEIASVTPSAETKNETRVKAETAAESTTEAPADTATSTGKMKVQTVTNKGIEEYASGFDGATENTGKQVAAMYDPQDGIDKETFVKGVEEAYKYGRFNYDYNSLAKDSTFAKELPDIKRKEAYAMGMESARIENARKAEEFKSRVLPGVKGKVVAENGVDLKKLPQHQRAVIKAVNKIISKATDVEFHIFSSYELKQDYTYTNAEGKRVTLEAGTRVTKINGHIIPAQNAFYVPGTNQIWVDTNAGNEGQGIMEQAIAHELLHYLRDRGSGSYDTFKKITAELFERKGLSFSDAVATKLAEYAAAGIKLDEDGAQEEVIAQTVSGLLNDTKTFEALSKEIYAKDKTLWNEIKRFLSQVIEKIDAALKGTDIEAYEARMLKEERDLYERAQKAFVEGVVEAGQNYKNYSNSLIEIDSDSKSVAPNIMYSLRTWTESEYVKARNETARAISQELNVTLNEAYDYIDSINSVAKLIADDKVRLDYDPNLDEHATVLKPNSEYGVTVDMSTLCAKRLLFTGTFDAIQKKFPNTVFDSDDIVKLRKMMMDRGYEVACGICYVESTRREIGRITQEFIDRYKVAQKTGKPISRINSSGAEVTLTSKGKTFMPEDGYVPNLGELNTTDIDLVKKDHPEVYNAYLAFMNARGQSKPKLLETRAEYKGEILKQFKQQKSVNDKNLEGGLRLQSFSDFELPHLIDMMQIVMDMSRVGLKSQAYTKVPKFAEAFGGTGIKINLSLIAKGNGLDADGNLIFDDVEGINHNEAFKLRDKFTDNVGTILVGKNDAHIIAAMADPRIDMIIPFHKSSWKESLYDALGLTGYTDYTKYQMEKPLDKSRKIKQYHSDEYWDYSKTGDENAKIYLEKCREDGRLPVFPQFQNYPGYWKLLIDFKMYNNDGVGAPHEVVKPVFDNEVTTKMLEEYEGGHRKFPVAQDIVEDFAKEYENKNPTDNPDIRYSLRTDGSKKKAVMSQQRIDYLIEDSGAGSRVDYAQAWITSISPTDFINLTTDKEQDREIFDKFGSEWDPNVNMGNYDYLAQLGKSVRQTPYLAVDINTGEVVGHDGRHRVRALEKEGIDSVEIKIEFRDEGYIAKYAPDMERWETKDSVKLTNQFGTKQTATIHNVIPLNEDHRSEIEASYGEMSTKDTNIKYSARKGVDNGSGKWNNKHKGSVYNEFDSIAMSWANETGRKAGDVKQFYSAKHNKMVDIEADGEGNFNVIYIYSEKEYEELYGHKRENRFSGDSSEQRISERRSLQDNMYLGNKRKYGEIPRQADSSKQTRSYTSRSENVGSGDSTTELNKEQVRLSSSDQNRIEILEKKIDRLEAELFNMEKTYEKAQSYARAEGVLVGKIEQGKQMAKAIESKKEQISKIRQQKNELLEQARKKTAEAVAKVRQADREKMEKRLADVKAKEREKLSAVKDRSKEKQLEIANKYRESIKKATEGRHSTDIRHKIKRVVGELNTMLTRQTKEKHIPLELQKPVAAALDMLNMDDQRYYESRLKGLDERIANAKTSEEKHLLEEERNKILDHREAFKDKLASLKEAYAAIEKSSDPYISVGYNANIAAMINNISEEIGDTLLRDMTKPQLEKVYDLYKAVLKTVRDANKLSAENKKATVIESGIEAIRELEKHKTIERVSEAKLNRLKFFWNNLKPVYAFRRMGSEVLEGMFKNIRKGEDTWATDVREAKDFSDRIKNRYNYKKWDFKKTYEFVSNTGKTFKLNLGQMMSLYAYSKRDQAYKHLTDGGFVFDDKATIKKNGREYHVNVASANNITVAELQKIVGTLSADQRLFVDEMQKYLSEVMGGKGNEVSRTLYDINLFKEGDSYFPLKSAKQFMAERNEVTNETKKLVNSGFTKPVQPGANNPIILSDFMDVWSNHVNDMSMYHAFTVPLEDFNKVYSFQVGRVEDTESVSVKSAMQNAFTKAANDYVEQLLKDINGGARTDPREGTYKKLIGNWKKAAVFASASVVIQQPSAIGRAFGEINPIYFIAPTEVGILKHRKQWEQVKKYAPVAFIKEMGYFDTDMGQSTTDYIKDEKTFKERLDNVMGWAPAMADELTWCAIWDAVKRETKAKHKDMTVNSEEFLKLAGERFTEVIVNTQVYDSVLSRSANMRSKGIFMNMLTAFMAEPTTTANMVEQAFREASRGHHKKAMGYIASVGTSVVLNSVLVSLVYAMRDDDEEERFHEKYLKALTQEIMDGFNPLTYIPLIKDIYSIFQGWKVERVDLSLVQDLYDATDKALKETLELFEGIESGDLSGAEIREALKGIGTDYVLPVVDVIGNMMGVPVKNIRRDIGAVFNTYDTITGQKDNPYSKARLDDILNDAVLDQLPYGHHFMESKDDRLFDGMKSKDKTYLERLKRTYKDEEAYDNAVKAVIKNNFLDGEITESQAKTYLMSYNGKDLEKAEEYLDSWKFEKKWGFQWSEREEAYANGQISASNLEKAIMEHKGKTAAEAEAERRIFDFKRAYPDTELTDDQIKNYYRPINIYNTDIYIKSIYEQGISEKTYSEYVKLKSGCKGVDKNGDGIADSGTVKKEVMKVINKLDLTKEQKDALYYSNNWAKGTLWEAPWR